MTTETLPTATLPPPRPGPDWLPTPGTYSAAPDRCIVELSARLGPLTTLRRRLTALDATLTVAPDPDDCVLKLELAGRTLNGRVLTFVSTSLTPTDEATRLHVPGELALAGDPATAVLGFRVVERTADRLLLLGTLRLPYRALRRTTGLTLPRTRPAAGIRLLVAAEFTCPA
ncbi:hypothetical protein [Streptomyces sp. NBC_00847]|uniref:hypothetical protein n=1 Tax=unclassified Streptomyces TaxID=2593676 RepID=UPI002255F2A8|nr:hypothetical protein [Streptomyces sp. NBC_00847]MCX4884203.1 hypothetical protein [Streptomyces sp. NBC_00847]